MRNLVARLIAILGLVVAVAAQTTSAPSDSVAKYVRVEMARQHIPGLAVLVSRDGKIVRAEGFGYSNLEHQVPVKPETVFQSGSVGKQFAATAIMMLVEQGKISLNDSITNYFKDAPATWKPVTIRHLLSHTGGFTDYPKGFDFRKDYTEGQILKIIEGIPLAFAPGTSWSYSNLGYATLGILIHRVTGEFYGDFLQQRIFQPLGMTTARIISEADIVPNRASGYRLVKGQIKNQGWVAPALNTTADGSLYFSILDMAKWDAALYTDRLVKQSTLQEMWTPVKLDNGKENSGHYGYAWDIERVKGHLVVSHGGSWQGFKSHIIRHVDDKLTVVVLANLAEADPGVISEHIAAMYVAGDVPASETP